MDKRISNANDDEGVKEVLLNFENLERMFTKTAGSVGAQLDTQKTFGTYRFEYSGALGPKLDKLINSFPSHVKVGLDNKIDED